MKLMIRILLVALLTTFSLATRADDLSPQVVAWLDAQSKIHTWTADFTQTRRLKSLTQPLTAHGKVSFAEPNRFRWELGNPPQTIAVRAPDELEILYPKLKRVEKFSLNAQQTGPWREALSLLEAGFPRSRAAIRQRYCRATRRGNARQGNYALRPSAANHCCRVDR